MRIQCEKQHIFSQLFILRTAAFTLKQRSVFTLYIIFLALFVSSWLAAPSWSCFKIDRQVQSRANHFFFPSLINLLIVFLFCFFKYSRLCKVRKTINQWDEFLYGASVVAELAAQRLCGEGTEWGVGVGGVDGLVPHQAATTYVTCLQGQTVLMPSSLYIDILSQPFASHSDAQGFNVFSRPRQYQTTWTVDVGQHTFKLRKYQQGWRSGLVEGHTQDFYPGGKRSPRPITGHFRNQTK